MGQLDARLREVDRKARSSTYEAKKEHLVKELEEYLDKIPGGGDLRGVTPKNLKVPGSQRQERQNSDSHTPV